MIRIQSCGIKRYKQHMSSMGVSGLIFNINKFLSYLDNGNIIQDT